MTIPISEFSARIHEDLDLQIEAVASLPDCGASIRVSLDSWTIDQKRRYFELIAKDVVEFRLWPGSSEEIVWTEDHPVLWGKQDSHSSLYFLQRSDRADEIFGILWRIH